MRRAALALLLMLAGAAPAHAHGPATELPKTLAVHPSGTCIPENLLRISIAFAAPPRGPILPLLALWNSQGQPIADPFLEQELWSPDGKTLTVLLHPGRVKSGLIAHETLGRALARGDEVTLVLAGQKVKSWCVEGEDRGAPEPAKWQLTRAQTGKRTALRIVFEAPIDAGAAAMLAVVDSSNQKVDGRAALVSNEGEWVFTPKSPWKKSSYRLLVHPRLEDAAGNTVRKTFESAIAPIATAPAQIIEIPILQE